MSPLQLFAAEYVFFSFFRVYQGLLKHALMSSLSLKKSPSSDTSALSGPS